MISSELIPFFFFVPIIFVAFFFVRYYIAYTKLYRKIKNPDFPLAASESTEYFQRDPLKFLITAPLASLMLWQIIFETHKDKELNKSAQKVRGMFFLFLIFIFGNFILLILATYFGIFR